VKTYEALAEGKTVDIQAQNWQIVGTGSVWRDLLEPSTARTIFHYVAPFEDYSACTVNAFGQGQVYYVATGLEDPLMDHVADLICQETGLVTIETPDDVEVVIRGTGEQQRYWVLNHNHEAVTFKGITLKALEVKVLESIMDK